MYESDPGQHCVWAPRPHTAMDKPVERIIRVLEEARAKGRDHITQTELAGRAVRKLKQS